MTKRICPSCKASLGDHESYFCSTCGNKLPEDLIRVSSSIRVRTYSPSQPEVSKGSFFTRLVGMFKNKSFWAALGLGLFILLVLVSISKTGVFQLIGLKVLPKSVTSGLSLPSPGSREILAFSLNLELSSDTFGEGDLVSHVPAEVDFYFEGSNLPELLKLLLFVEEDTDFTPKGKILLEQQFAGFAYDEGEVNRWGYLFIPKDTVLAQENFGNGWNDYWKIAFIDEYMIIANNTDVFDLVKSVDGGVSLSLAQNPEYVKKLQSLPEKGQFQLFFMTPEAQAIVRDSLGGLTQEIIGKINKILISGYDSLVISNSSGQK